MSPSVTEILMSPEIATDLLETNKMNRKVRQDWVDYLALEMAEGRWHINGDTFKVDATGVLADGQHRCLAVIKANYSYPAILVEDIEPEARLTMDDPMRRKFADDLVMNGRGPNANLKEAVLRKILVWQDVKGFAASSARTGRARLAGEFPKYRDEIDDAMALAFSHHKTPLGDSVGTFIAWLLLRNAPADVVHKFFSILAIGSQSKDDRVVVALRDRILTLKADPMSGYRGARTPLVIWLTIRGWNAWVTGANTTFGMPRGRKLENPFPQPARLERGK